jgi:hypothetical protein
MHSAKYCFVSALFLLMDVAAYRSTALTPDSNRPSKPPIKAAVYVSLAAERRGRSRPSLLAREKRYEPSPLTPNADRS